MQFIVATIGCKKLLLFPCMLPIICGKYDIYMSIAVHVAIHPNILSVF